MPYHGRTSIGRSRGEIVGAGGGGVVADQVHGSTNGECHGRRVRAQVRVGRCHRAVFRSKQQIVRAFGIVVHIKQYGHVVSARRQLVEDVGTVAIDAIGIVVGAEEHQVQGGTVAREESEAVGPHRVQPAIREGHLGALGGGEGVPHHGRTNVGRAAREIAGRGGERVVTAQRDRTTHRQYFGCSRPARIIGRKTTAAIRSGYVDRVRTISTRVLGPHIEIVGARRYAQETHGGVAIGAFGIIVLLGTYVGIATRAGEQQGVPEIVERNIRITIVDRDIAAGRGGEGVPHRRGRCVGKDRSRNVIVRDRGSGIVAGP